MAYAIEFTPEADEHFKRFTARERATLVDRLEKQLVHQPSVETQPQAHAAESHRAVGASRRPAARVL